MGKDTRSRRYAGFENLGELLNLPPNPNVGELGEKEFKTVGKVDVVATVAYLLGMRQDIWDNYYKADCGKLLDKLKVHKEVNIIRALCTLRTNLMQNFKKTDNDMRYNLGNIDRMGWFDGNAIRHLISNDVPVLLTNTTADRYCDHFAALIDKYIDKCEGIFPEWVNFQYMRELFSVPKYQRPSVLKKEFNKYMEYFNAYPFQLYLHWEPVEDAGNILASDGKFLKIIYEEHKDSFDDKSKVRDAVASTKESIYDFIKRSQETVLVVDCENSDVYKLYGVLKSLDEDEVAKISKIVLYDDYFTNNGWGRLANFVKIPIEHIEVERVTNQKSLVDIKMTAGVCAEYYRNNIESFILCSSDSDFWGLISSLPTASFLVMYEYEKCGKDIKDALDSRQIYHCAMDDFYNGGAQELKKLVLKDELKRHLDKIVGMNAWELTKEIYLQARIEESEANMKQFCEKYVKTCRLVVGEDGFFKVVMKE